MILNPGFSSYLFLKRDLIYYSNLGFLRMHTEADLPSTKAHLAKAQRLKKLSLPRQFPGLLFVLIITLTALLLSDLLKIFFWDTFVLGIGPSALALTLGW